MKKAVVYKTKDSFVFHSEAKTKTGIYIASSCIFRLLFLDSNDEEIFKCMNSVLNDYKENVKHPEDWNLFFKQYRSLLNSVGLKNNFDKKGSKLCNVSLEENGILTFMPTQFEKETNSFNHILNNNITVSIEENISSIIKNLNKTFDLCC